MSKVLFNPTVDKLEYFHNGILVTLPPYPETGHKKEVHDTTANHLINALGQRGLQVLQFGDEGEGVEKKAEEGRRLNREFKKRQIIAHNRQNEDHKQTNRPYIYPTDEVRKYAEELGHTLMEPYTVKDAQNEDMVMMRKQLNQQMQVIDDLTKRLSEFIKSDEDIKEASDKADAEKAQHAELISTNRKRYASLPGKRFPNFINNNIDDINAMPIENRTEIRMRWGELLQDEPFPDVINME